MNISKRKQGILAIICTIAMIVTSITVYNPREVKADADYSKLTYNYKHDYKKDGEAFMKGSGDKKSPWKVAIDASQSKGDIVNWMTKSDGFLNFYGEKFMQVTWHDRYKDVTLEINGAKVEKGGDGVQTFDARQIHVDATKWINNNAYNVVKLTSADGSQYVTFIVATGDKAVTSSEETTTGSSTKPLGPSDIKDSEWTLASGSKTVSYYIADGKANKVQVRPQLEGDNYYIAFSLAAKFKSVTFDGEPKDVTDGAYYRVKVSDLTSGYHTLVVTDHEGKESVTIYFKVAGEEGTTKYTVSIDGVPQDCKEGATIAVPADGQGYYNVTKKEAYAPGTELTVNESMTLKSIKLNVTMTPGASIRLAAPTGLRFKTNVTGTTDILSQSDIIKTGTIITASDILDGGTVDDNFVKSDKLKLNIKNENNGWYGKTVGTFCASIVELQKVNYTRDYVGVGYVTITYNDGTEKTIYAPSGTVRTVATVAQNIQNSKDIYKDGMTYYNYLKSLNKGYETIIDTYAAATKNNQ